MVVAQLEERSLPTPEVCGSNPFIGIILNRKFLYCSLLKIQKVKKKRPGMTIFLKKYSNGLRRNLKAILSELPTFGLIPVVKKLVDADCT